MKTFITLCFFLLTGVGTLTAQCNQFFQIEEGMSWEMTNYDKKGKQEGRQITRVMAMDETSDGWDATLQFTAFDKKDKEQLQQEMEITCDDGTMKMDMSRFFPAEMPMNENMNMEITTENLVWPSDLDVGQTLPDATLLMDMGMMKITVSVVDRKVESKESITTPAGTFECYKISYTTKMKFMGEREYRGVDYIAKKVGVVKTESFDKKGELASYSELTKFGGA